MTCRLTYPTFGMVKDHSQKENERRLQKVNALKSAMEAQSDDDLRNKTAEFRQRLKAASGHDEAK